MSEFIDRERFRLDHRWAPSQLSSYLDGELAARRRRRMERHLGECAECRRLLAGLRLVLDSLHRLRPPAGGEGALSIAASVHLRLSEGRR